MTSARSSSASRSSTVHHPYIASSHRTPVWTVARPRDSDGGLLLRPEVGMADPFADRLPAGATDVTVRSLPRVQRRRHPARSFHPAGSYLHPMTRAVAAPLIKRGGARTRPDHHRPPHRSAWSVMPAAEPRYGVAQVSEESRDGWRDFCDRYDVDRTALAEVIGLELGNLHGPLPRHLERWVERAKDLKNQRRRRD